MIHEYLHGIFSGGFDHNIYTPLTIVFGMLYLFPSMAISSDYASNHGTKNGVRLWILSTLMFVAWPFWLPVALGVALVWFIVWLLLPSDMSKFKEMHHNWQHRRRSKKISKQPVVDWDYVHKMEDELGIPRSQPKA